MSVFSIVVISKTIHNDSRKLSLNQNSKARGEKINFCICMVSRDLLAVKASSSFIKEYLCKYGPRHIQACFYSQSCIYTGLTHPSTIHWCSWAMTLGPVSDATEMGTKKSFTNIFKEHNLSFISTMHVILTEYFLI